MSRDGVHGMHVDIPQELWDRFRRICPTEEKGMVRITVTRLLKAYVTAVENNEPVIAKIDDLRI